MALVVATIQAAAKAAVEAEFPNFDNSAGQTEAQIGASMGDLIASIVPSIINAIKDDADLTGVTAGTDTVAGGID